MSMTFMQALTKSAFIVKKFTKITASAYICEKFHNENIERMWKNSQMKPLTFVKNFLKALASWAWPSFGGRKQFARLFVKFFTIRDICPDLKALAWVWHSYKRLHLKALAWACRSYDLWNFSQSLKTLTFENAYMSRTFM